MNKFLSIPFSRKVKGLSESIKPAEGSVFDLISLVESI